MTNTEASTRHHIFVSHGTMWQAYHGDPAWPALGLWFAAQPPPATIVAVSAHWAESVPTVTTDVVMPHLAEGFPHPLDRLRHQPPGSPLVAEAIIDLLGAAGITARRGTGRGLDHGAIIPLRVLDPMAAIPTVQLSLQQDFDPTFHLQIGAALRDLPSDVMVIASGGLVHNRQRIKPMSGRTIAPEQWAIDFDAAARSIVLNATGKERGSRLAELADSSGFVLAHPTPEHFTPLFVASGLGGKATQIANGFQWQNLSMASFSFAR
jgi:4,5-DOPA dioxygenase extradiol